MNKRFSTLLAAALVAGGVSAFAQVDIKDAAKVAEGTTNDSLVVKGSKITFTKNVALAPNTYWKVTEEGTVIDGNGKTFKGHLYIDAANVTVKNLTINSKAEGNPQTELTNETKRAITLTMNAAGARIIDNVFNCSGDKGTISNGITLYPASESGEYRIRRNKFNAALPVVESYDKYNSFAILVPQGNGVGYDLKANETFDKVLAEVKQNEFKNFAGDYAISWWSDDFTKETIQAVRVTPIKKEGKFQNQLAIADLVSGYKSGAEVVFNGTPEDLSVILDKVVVNEGVEPNIVYGDGTEVEKVDLAKFANKKAYYTITTDKKVGEDVVTYYLSGRTDNNNSAWDAVENFNHETLWALDITPNEDTTAVTKAEFVNLESGKTENIDLANTFVKDENTFCFRGVAFTVTEQELVADGLTYDSIEMAEGKNETYNLGIYSNVYDNTAWFTENHGKPSHILGLDEDEDKASVWTIAEAGNVELKKETAWFDTTLVKVPGEGKQPKGWQIDSVTIKVPTYTFTNEYAEALGYNKGEKKYGANETALRFVLKKADATYYNLIQVREKEGDKEAGLGMKVYAAHSPKGGFLAQTGVYTRTENDLVNVALMDPTYDYRHLTADEEYVSFFEANEPSIQLWEDGKFLAAGNVCTDAKFTDMYAHLAYQDAEDAGKAQYLLALAPEFTEGDTIWCNATEWHKHETLADSLACTHTHIITEAIAGRYLVCYADSTDAKDDDYHTPGYSDIYEYDGMPRLGFVAAEHIDTSFVVMSDVKDTVIVNKNDDKPFKFAFKYVEPQASVNEDAEFYIESDCGFLKAINGVVVSTKDEADATAFNLKQGSKDNATANEGIEAAGVSVVAANGAVIVKGAEGKKVVISNVLGQTIANTVVTSSEATIAAPAGVVVVAVEGETAVKAIVK